MKIECVGTTITGRRDENQDNYICEMYETPRGGIRGLVAVCDGMGGHAGGQIASQLAIDVITKQIETPPADNNQVETWIRDTIHTIQRHMKEKSAEDPNLKEMGTTLALGIVTDQSLWIANIGDSRVYQIEEKGAIQRTRDHTAIQDAIDRGLYTLDQVRDDAGLHYMASALLQCLGPESNIKADINEIPLFGGECFLFCSDGLTGSVVDFLVSPYEIWKYTTATPDLQTAAENLTRLAYQNGSSDNITVVLLEIGDLTRREESIPVLPSIEALQQRNTAERNVPAQPRKTMKWALWAAIIFTTGWLFFLIYLFIQQSALAPERGL